METDFEFLNSDIWLKYTQERYLPVSDIKYRLEQGSRITSLEWEALKKKIIFHRKMGAVPLFLSSIEKKFWFFPSDCLYRKIDQIEKIGTSLYEKINASQNFKNDFLSNSLIEESITSAIYEGANTTRSKAKELIETNRPPKNRDEWMLINNFQAMSWIRNNLNLKLSEEVVLMIHKIVTKNTLEVDDASFSGKFRNDRVFVGGHEGIPHQKISEAMKDVNDLTTNHPRYLHGLIKGILLHYFVAYIHPFFDGNGRTARTLFYFKAIKNQLDFVELLSVSADLKEHGKRYEKSFDLVKDNLLDTTYFIDFCLDSLLTASQKVERKINYLLNIANFGSKSQLGSDEVTLLQRLALHKFREVTIESHAAAINKSREMSRRQLKELSSRGLLEEIKRGKKYTYRINKKALNAKLKEI